MAAINTRVVRRSNALLGYRYGRSFEYVEKMRLPASPKGLSRGGPGAAAHRAPARRRHDLRGPLKPIGRPRRPGIWCRRGDPNATLGGMRSLLFASVAALTACGPGTVAQKVTTPTPPPSGAEALGEKPPVCSGEPEAARPLVLDASAQLRLDLELAMREGVAVVRYDCASLEVLPRCKLEGSYRFAGVNRKEEVIRLSNADQIAANLPLGVASLRGKLKRSEALDLAMVLVGRQSTSHRGLLRSADTFGDGCEGATHLVQAAFVGAFALNRGSEGKVGTAVEVFGAGAEGSSSTKQQNISRDGDVKACHASSPEASAPPSGCGATIRLDLIPVVAEQITDELAPETPGCPDGFVRVGEECVDDPSLAHVCSPDDEAACQKQCNAGNMPSCYNLARLHDDPPQTGLTPEPRTKALGLFRKACDGGVQAACVGLGDVIIGDAQRTRRPPIAQALDEALPLYEQACAAGVARGCARQASIYSRGGQMRPDPERAMPLARRACDLGSGPGCSLLASELVAKEDIDAAYDAYARGCDGGDIYGCIRVAMLGFLGADHVHGITGRKPDPSRSERHARRACRINAGQCVGMTRFVKKGKDELDTWIRGIACDEGAERYCAK